ncbi:MAG: hypothetical protein H7Y13_17820 [Sphingobacteriaceae bacterium]|nr:hypothetical protein [Sphingobacteriaceae bacterium]
MKRERFYFTFNGNTEETFTFYKSGFGGEFILKRKTDSRCQQYYINPLRKNHRIALPLGSNLVILNISINEIIDQVIALENFDTSVEAENEDEAEKVMVFSRNRSALVNRKFHEKRTKAFKNMYTGPALF